MRYVLDVKLAQDLEPRDLVLLGVHPFVTARVMGVRVDHAADHPAWQGGDQVYVAFDRSDDARQPGHALLPAGERVVLLAPATPELIVLPSEFGPPADPLACPTCGAPNGGGYVSPGCPDCLDRKQR